MATLFIDYENGNDNYAGTSFSLLASATDGRITGSTFSSTSANFPNDGSLINQYLSIFNGSIYAIYQITAWISNTSLTITVLSGGTALADQTIDRQYYIGGRWKNINTGATAVRTIAGDTIRIMSSPSPTSLGINGTWTSSKIASTISISSSTNATPISVTTSSAHNYSTGDTIVITGHTTNTNANGTWSITVTGSTTFTLDGSTGNGVGGASGTTRKRNNTVVTLASALTQNVASFGQAGNGRTAWTASTNVTASLLTTDTKEGDSSDSMAIAAAFTTGKAAYKATGTLNLSGYQQISFWIKQTAGTVTVNGDISLRLCTDSTGDTVAHTCNIEGLTVLNAWTPITIDLGTNLNSNIQSIALYVDTDRGAQTFLLSNIIACKASSSADSLNLQSLIGKNTTNETWWAIQSINGTRVFLDSYPSYAPFTAANKGYYGTSETILTYKRECIKTPLAPTASTQVVAPNEGGSTGNNINYEFGWDRTNMATQNSETWLDGRNGNGYGIYINGLSNLSFNKLSLIRYYMGVSAASPTNLVANKFISLSFNTWGLYVNNGSNNAAIGNNNWYVDWMIGNSYGCEWRSNIFNNNLYNCKIYGNNYGVYWNSLNYWNSLYQGQLAKCSIDSCLGYNNNRAFYFNGSTNSFINNCIATDNAISSFELIATMNLILKSCSSINNTNGINITTSATNNKFINCISSGNPSSILYYYGHNNYMYNCILNEATEFNPAFNSSVLGNCKLYSQNHDNTIGNHVIFTDYGSIQSSVAVRYSNSGFAWALSPTSTVRSSIYPLDLEIAKVAVNANSLVTIRVWMRRNNTGLTTGLRIKGNQIAGVPNDITSYMTAAADTWEQVALSFTPTEAGVVEILAECWGGSTFTAYVDDISITQI